MKIEFDSAAGLVERIIRITKDRKDISELTKAHVIDALYDVMFGLIELNHDEVQKELNSIFDRLLFRSEENAETH